MKFHVTNVRFYIEGGTDTECALCESAHLVLPDADRDAKPVVFRMPSITLTFTDCSRMIFRFFTRAERDAWTRGWLAQNRRQGDN